MQNKPARENPLVVAEVARLRRENPNPNPWVLMWHMLPRYGVYLFGAQFLVWEFAVICVSGWFALGLLPSTFLLWQTETRVERNRRCRER